MARTSQRSAARLARPITTAALALTLAAGTALAASPDENPLGGPTQTERSAVERSMESREGFGMNRARYRAANPQNLMGAAIRALDEAADEALHLTESQRRALDEIRAEFDDAVQAFREDNAETLQALRERGAELRELVQAGDEAARGAMQELRAEMQAIRESAPSFEEIRGSIEAVFNDAQKAFIEDAIQELQAVAQERGRRGTRGGPMDGMGGAPGAGMGEGMGAARGERPEPSADALQLREIAARLQNLPDEDRARITQLLEAMIAQVEADRGIDPAEALERMRERGAGADRPQRERRGEGRQRRGGA